MLLTTILALALAAYAATAWIVSLTLAAEQPVPGSLPDSKRPAVAVVVPARNEERHIAQCVRSLLAQTYPAECLEIVVVDDHSEDSTAEILRQFAEQEPRLVVVDPSAFTGQAGKARAIALGIEATSAEVVLTTDADCEPPPEWVSRMVDRLYADEGACLGGTTVVAGRSLFARAQALDWLLGFAVAGALSELGHPLTAMGNNMAFLRLDYEAVGGYRRFASSPTEDYALFRSLSDRAGGARLVVAPELTTATRPARTVGRLLSQRRRWARGGLTARPPAYALYATIWLAHVAPLLALPLAPSAALIGVALKAAADGMVLHWMHRRLRRRTDWGAFPLLEGLLWLYVLLVPFTLLLSPALSWKGRKL